MIVIFGSQGQLGSAFQELIGQAPEHVFLTRSSQDYCGDILDTAGITETLMTLRPEIIINAAAYTAVDQAEQDIEAATAANARAPGVIAQIAAKIDSLLIHYSTDYVFDGSGPSPWDERATCKPLSVYGKTKRAGEEAVIAAGGRHFILRASWLYSRHGKNFLKTMLQLAETKEEIRVVNDQWGVPTHVDYLAGVTLDLINLATPGFGSTGKTPDYGIYHCAPAGETNWFEYAKLVINTAKAHGAAGKVKKVIPVPSSEYPTAAVRPLNSRLNADKLAAVLKVDPADWQEDVILTVGQVLQEQEEENP
jgi:dTDP-4-dehydrorhamnose reductase